MEVSCMKYYGDKRIHFAFCFLLAMLFSFGLQAQPVHPYSIKNGRMYIQLPKDVKEAELDSFIVHYDLKDLDLKNFIRAGRADSLLRQGWAIEVNSDNIFVISKAFEPFSVLKSFEDMLIFKEANNALFPMVNNGVVVGVNRFKKQAFTDTGMVVQFFLRQHTSAKKVMLAGSFNQWNPDELRMKKTDSGWLLPVQLKPGKHWYKFIVDGEWITDENNLLAENDGQGNINSVYYKPNAFFHFAPAKPVKRVFLTGSFNNWDEKEFRMQKTAAGWQLPLYLADGTHTYKFIADDEWFADENNPDKLPDGHNGYNSVLRLGTTHLFQLKGFETAKSVFLVGSFNGWKEDELAMQKSSDGWQLSYAIGAGNYEYKFKVDGQWMSDPANPITASPSGNSFLIISPNYTFRLKGFEEAKEVFLAGDFNGWNPTAYPMKKEGGEWKFPVHLSTGKHLYKFVVDGKWVRDPHNEFWEQNEFDTGNSVIWIEK